MIAAAPLARPAPAPETEAPPSLTSLEQVLDVLRRDGEAYLRISPGPRTDRYSGMRDADSGCLLPGLPVWAMRPEPWWPAGPRLWAARQLVRHGYLLSGGKGHVAWLLTGEEVGRGPEGEPLVGSFRPVATVAPAVLAEAESAYAAWRLRDLH